MRLKELVHGDQGLSMGAMWFPGVIWQCLGMYPAAIAGPGPCGWSQGCCTHLQAHWIAAPPPTAFRQRGPRGRKGSGYFVKSKAHTDFCFLRGSGGLGQERTARTEEAASCHLRQKEPKPQAEAEPRTPLATKCSPTTTKRLFSHASQLLYCVAGTWDDQRDPTPESECGLPGALTGRASG